MNGIMNEAAPNSEELLLKAARAGDDDALGRLFELHRPRLERIVKLRLDRRLQGYVAYADVVRDLFRALREKFTAEFDPDKISFFVWLRLELGQALVDVHRHHLGAPRRDAGLDLSLEHDAMPRVTSLSLAERLLGAFGTPSQATLRAAVKLRVQEAINRLDPQDRDLVALRHFEELTNSEAAELLGIRSSAACSRYLRALKHLKQVMDK